MIFFAPCCCLAHENNQSVNFNYNDWVNVNVKVNFSKINNDIRYL